MIQIRRYRVNDLIEQVREMEGVRRQARRVARLREMDRQEALRARIEPIVADCGLSAQVSALNPIAARLMADDGHDYPIEYWVEVIRYNTKSEGRWFSRSRTTPERVFVVRVLDDDSIQMNASSWHECTHTITTDAATDAIEAALAKAIAGVKIQ